MTKATTSGGSPHPETPCPVCAFAKVHAYWPARHGLAVGEGTHCHDCHRDWVSAAQAHCLVCHEQFASNGVADRHWTKAGHMHPSEVVGLHVSHETFGPVWRSGNASTALPPWHDRSQDSGSSLSEAVAH